MFSSGANAQYLEYLRVCHVITKIWLDRLKNIKTMQSHVLLKAFNAEICKI